MSYRGHASWAKITLPGGMLTALVCDPTKKLTKAENLTYLCTNIDWNYLQLITINTNWKLLIKYIKSCQLNNDGLG